MLSPFLLLRSPPFLPRCSRMCVQHRLAHRTFQPTDDIFAMPKNCRLRRLHGSANAREEMQHASHDRVLDEEVWRFAPSELEQRVQECVRCPENDAVVDVRHREVHSFGEHRTQFVEAAQLLEGSVMRPRFLPRILIGKQALVQLLDKTKEELSVAGLTSARESIVLEVAGQHVCLPRVHSQAPRQGLRGKWSQCLHGRSCASA